MISDTTILQSRIHSVGYAFFASDRMSLKRRHPKKTDVCQRGLTCWRIAYEEGLVWSNSFAAGEELVMASKAPSDLLRLEIRTIVEL